MLKKKHSFLIYLVPQYLLFFILNTAWRRIAADIKVKVKRARRLQAYLKPEEKRENSNINFSQNYTQTAIACICGRAGASPEWTLLQVCVHLDGSNTENTFHCWLYSV